MVLVVDFGEYDLVGVVVDLGIGEYYWLLVVSDRKDREVFVDGW